MEILRKPLFWVLAAALGAMGLVFGVAIAAVAVWAMAGRADAEPTWTEFSIECPGYGAEEVERRRAIPAEVALAGIPRLKRVLSLSVDGRAHVALEFEPGVPGLQAAELVAKRLQLAEGLGDGATPRLSSGGRKLRRYVLANAVDATHSAVELRTIQENIVRPRLLRIVGVAEVSALGGASRRVEIAADPARLAARALGVESLRRALVERTAPTNDEAFVGRPASDDPSSLADLVVSNAGGTPIRVRDVASVEIVEAPRGSWVSADRRLLDGSWQCADDAVEGLVWVNDTVDAAKAFDSIDQALAELKSNAGDLPPGVNLVVGPSDAPPGGPDVVWVHGLFPSGTTAQQAIELMGTARGHLQQNGVFDEIVAEMGPAIGRPDPPRAQGSLRRAAQDSLRRASLRLKCASGRKAEFAKLRDDVRQQLETELPGVAWRVSRFAPSPWYQWASPTVNEAAIKIFGPDLDELQRLASALRDRLRDVRGVAAAWSVGAENAPVLRWKVDRERCAQVEVADAEVDAVIAMGRDAVDCGRMGDGADALDVVLRWPAHLGGDVEALSAIALPSSGGGMIRLGNVAEARIEQTALQVYREQGRRLIVVRLELVGGKTAEVEAKVRAATAGLIEPPYTVEWETP